MQKNQHKEIIDNINNKFEDYKKFAFKGHMIEMAIAFILGASFSKVVKSISENLIMPLINVILFRTGGNWREITWSPIEGVVFEIGKFLAAGVDFFLISIVLFILWRIAKGIETEIEDKVPFYKKLWNGVKWLFSWRIRFEKRS